jgi:hypothetical protein
MKPNKTQLEIINKLAKQKQKILDDFCMAYLSSRYDDYFSKKKANELRRLVLVEERTANGYIYSFKLKRGKLPKIN